ncbi:MAG: HDOD domain-containing protein [Verrucomicrobiae bacterium]|nr:HDOD domain-containing protein [Verrucomicrobiae bacterium]
MNSALLYLHLQPPEQGSRPSETSSKASTQKLTMRERVVSALQRRTDLPAFPATAHRLAATFNNPLVDISEVAEIARLDPGITSRCLRLASSPVFGGHIISTLEEALMLLGANEVRKVAASIVVIDSLKHMRVKINWELFWLHSLLVARLAERLANAYRETDGREYMAGLLHDVGKLFIEYYFPQEFELVLMRAVNSRAGMYEAESRLLDINHAEVTAMLCDKWNLNHELIGGIQFHHEPLSSFNSDPNDPTYTPLLALCICIADRIANICHANIQGAENWDNVAVESMTEWTALKEKFKPVRTLMLDVAGELQKAQELIASFKEPLAKAQ